MSNKPEDCAIIFKGQDYPVVVMDVVEVRHEADVNAILVKTSEGEIFAFPKSDIVAISPAGLQDFFFDQAPEDSAEDHVLKYQRSERSPFEDLQWRQMDETEDGQEIDSTLSELIEAAAACSASLDGAANMAANGGWNSFTSRARLSAQIAEMKRLSFRTAEAARNLRQ